MQDNEKESRADGYKNLMNKYGTQDDVSEQYRFESDDPVTDDKNFTIYKARRNEMESGGSGQGNRNQTQHHQRIVP